MRSLIVLLPLAALLAACDRQSGEAEQAQPAPAVAPAQSGDGGKEAPARIDTSFKGRPAPAESFLDPAGKPVSLADFKGRPLMVNLWATWCAPCVAEMPMLDRLAQREKDSFRLLVISQDIAGKRAVEPFFAKGGFKALEPYLDKENALMLALKSETLPLTIFYDAEGREQWRVIGALDWEGPEAAALIAQGLGAK